MQPIEFYTDYRVFLADYYTWKKVRFPGFSYRNFCAKALLTSPSIYKEVVAGKRNLTPASIAAFVKGLGLSERDGRFFENLVLFNQAKRDDAKQKYLANLRGLKYRKPQKIIPVHLHEYYSKWYNPVIRELAVMKDWKGDFAALARAVRPPIKTAQARSSVQLQIRLGFLMKNSEGALQQAEPDITTGAEVNSLAVRQLNRELARLGAEAIDRFPPPERDISSLIMGIPRQKLPQLKQEIADFRRRLVTLADSDEQAESVFGLVLEFFPLAGFEGPEEKGGDHA